MPSAYNRSQEGRPVENGFLPLIDCGLTMIDPRTLSSCFACRRFRNACLNWPHPGTDLKTLPKLERPAASRKRSRAFEFAPFVRRCAACRCLIVIAAMTAEHSSPGRHLQYYCDWLDVLSSWPGSNMCSVCLCVCVCVLTERRVDGALNFVP